MNRHAYVRSRDSARDSARERARCERERRVDDIKITRAFAERSRARGRREKTRREWRSRIASHRRASRMPRECAVRIQI